MAAKINNKYSAVTFIEILTAITILAIVVLGALGVRYYAALDARGADVKNSAARLCCMLCDSWKSTGADWDYDPESLFSSELDISDSATGPAVPMGFNELGKYYIVRDRAHLYATLSYKDPTPTEPKMLNISIGWLPMFTAGAISNYDKSVNITMCAEY